MRLDLDGLAAASREALIAEWRQVVGRPPPKHLSKPLMVQILSHAYQLDTVGGYTKRLDRTVGLRVLPGAMWCALHSSQAAALCANITGSPMWLRLMTLMRTVAAHMPPNSFQNIQMQKALVKTHSRMP